MSINSSNWTEQPLSELVEHIRQKYHVSLRTEIPSLVELATRLEMEQDQEHACPSGLSELLHDLQGAVESHLDKEEQILFPLILAGRGSTAHMPVHVMMKEHEDQYGLLRRIRRTTGEFSLPNRAWSGLYRSLERLEAEILEHIKMENEILFPRALSAEE